MRSRLSRKYEKSGMMRSTPGKSSSGNITPQSTMRIFSSYSYTSIFLPISQQPPKAITFIASRLIQIPLKLYLVQLFDNLIETSSTRCRFFVVLITYIIRLGKRPVSAQTPNAIARARNKIIATRTQTTRHSFSVFIMSLRVLDVVNSLYRVEENQRKETYDKNQRCTNQLY